MRTRLLAVLTLSACGPGAIPFDSLGIETIKAYCKKLVECGAAGSESACEAQFGNITQVLNPYKEAVDSGKIKYDGARARSCVDSIAKTECSKFPLDSTNMDCRLYFQGQVKLGEQCASHAECAPDAYCARSGGATCSGICAQRIAEGADAPSGSQCEVGLVVRNGKCEKPATAGAACMGFSGCEQGLFCGSANVCQKYRAESETCDTNQLCGALLTCKDGKCSRYITAGQSCASGSGTADCQLELFCEPTSRVCALRRDSGGMCTSSSACKEPLRCTGNPLATMTCTQPVAEGGSCANFAQCDSATYCEIPSLICRKRIADGQPCGAGQSCQSFSSCTMGTCRPFSCP